MSTDELIELLDRVVTDDGAVAEHIRDHGTDRGDKLWLPAVYSERDDALRARIVAELGSPVPSGYMSEECGWWLDIPE